MAERLTITIPDELHQRLQDVKSTLNISRLCASCIDLAVSIEELKKAEVKDMDGLVKRLTLEKQQYESEIKQQGIQDGLEDALELEYQEFIEISESQEKEEYALNDDLKEWLNDRRINYFEKWNETKEQIYLEGWIEGVLAIWEKVGNEL